MKTRNFSKSTPALSCFVILAALTQAATAETLIYNNTIDSGYYFAPAPNGFTEVLDFGTSPGGNVVRFIFGCYTTYSGTQTVTIRFYRYTDASTCPGTLIKTFYKSISGYGDHIVDVTLLSGDQFSLPGNNDFGYSYEFTHSSSAPLLTSGGSCSFPLEATTLLVLSCREPGSSPLWCSIR